MAQSRTRSTIHILLILSLCAFCYVLGSWRKTNIGRGDLIARTITKQTECSDFPFPLTLNYETHHTKPFISSNQTSNSTFEPCHKNYTDYTPCHEGMKNTVYRERHCPNENQKIYCLIPVPKGYVTPFRWPKSRDYVPYSNVFYRNLTVEKAVQNGIRFDRGNVFRFPGGVDRYIDQLASVVPIGNGTIRTALDIGCGVASFGAYLLSRNVLTMSFTPRDSHEAQAVQIALERGVPAVIGALGTMKLPYPSSSFDMAHCSQCLIPWTSNDGIYMMEIDRVLRPGGYWVLSGPPINYKNRYKSWNRTMKDLESEQMKIEFFAELLCWEKISEIDETAIWRKPIDLRSCYNGKLSHVKTCDTANQDDVWYKEMEVCKTGNPKSDPAQLEPFPERLYAVPPRVATGTVPRTSPNMYRQDNELWRKRVEAYTRVDRFIGTDRYRNVMDMNAGMGGFGAAMGTDDKLWVMNVVPTFAGTGTLGVVYERGMIGIYHDWCEAFSTYPRTYDLIHANGIFSLYQNRCKMEDILLEMDRILRPEGAVIIRESIDLLSKVGSIAGGMRWEYKIVDQEDGPHSSEKVLFAVKKYWVGGSQN